MPSKPAHPLHAGGGAPGVPPSAEPVFEDLAPGV